MADTLRERIAAALAAHEPVTDYAGTDGECIDCDLLPDSPILPPSDGWKRHAEHLADAVIAELKEFYDRFLAGLPRAMDPSADSRQ